MKKLSFVDAFRGLAVISVLMLHCSQYGANDFNKLIKNIQTFGARGVQLFFVTSAFTLFLSLNNRKEYEKNIYYNFFIRRFFRIAPMYYLAIAYYFFENGLTTKATYNDILANMLFIHGINPYWINRLVPGGWSITVEVFFYCLVPILFQKIKCLNHAIYFLIATIIVRFILLISLKNLHIIEDNSLWKLYLFYYFPNQLPVFSCGIIMYFLVIKSKSELYISPINICLLSLIFIIGAAAGLDLISSVEILIPLSFIGLGYSLSKKRNIFFVNPLTQFIGKISFSIYLVHFMVLYWIGKLGYVDLITQSNIQNINLINFIFRFLLVFIVSVIISIITYQIIEIPFQKIGAGIIKNNENIIDSNKTSFS